MLTVDVIHPIGLLFKRPRAIAKQLFLVNTRKKSNEKTKKSNEKTNNSDKFKRPLPDLYLRPSLRISTAGTSKFPQNSKFQSEARFGFSAKKAVHSDGYRPKIRSICHVTDIKPDSASPRRSVQFALVIVQLFDLFAM